MKRQALNYLMEWKNTSNRKPMIIRGARQVGKTWLMKEFAKREYKQSVYINFDGNPDMYELFSQDFNIERILEGLSISHSLKINPDDTLLIFDEIQECPKALTSLKYFYENAPQYQIVAAGSLLGVALHAGTSFPVGKVDFMDLYPLSFLEFLNALGLSNLQELIIKQDFEMIKTFKTRLLELLRQYYFVGGMPEAVSTFVNNKDYEKVRHIQNNILTAYDQDFSKHIAPLMVTKIRMLWNSIASQLTKENKKFIYGAIKQGARASEYEFALTWLMDCGLVYKVNRVEKPGLPLKAYEDLSAFKLFVLDVGLLSALSKLDIGILLEKNQIFTEFKGSLTEAYALQQIKTLNGVDAFYWSNYGKAEIDFLLQIKNQIIPVETKAETNLKAKSLKAYCDKYNPNIAIRFSTADFKKTDNIYDIPLYMIGQTKEIINKD